LHKWVFILLCFVGIVELDQIFKHDIQSLRQIVYNQANFTMWFRNGCWNAC
jgi:hypothetical protein